MGGLAAAIRLAQHGYQVRVLEARPKAGGLASRIEFDDLIFDAGPYVLLDRPGLEWVFDSLGLQLEEHITLQRIDDIYQVTSNQGPPVRFLNSLERTAAELEHNWTGSGRRYLNFVETTGKVYRRLQPIQRVSQPGLADLMRIGAWRDVPFLLRSLSSVLKSTGLPEPIVNAIGIWTHIAGQRGLSTAPSPLAFVPALIHYFGAYYPAGGIGTIPEALAAIAAAAGVEFRYNTKVRSIRSGPNAVCGVETDQDEFMPAAAVISNAAGIGTYLELLAEIPARARAGLMKLPLQSPGVCAYLAVKGKIPAPYLRFYLPGGDKLCRLLVTPAAIAPDLEHDGWYPARLIAPMDYNMAQVGGSPVQREYLERILAEPWWQEHITEFRVLATRIPARWGTAYHLYRNSMNPVMTARLMRAGRLAHRSPYMPGLYLTGSSTHPGQWVSFCAISGILAADLVRKDLD
jgi:phytoene dehydrogenase-like protein